MLKNIKRSRLDFCIDYNFAPNGAPKNIIYEQFYHNNASPKLKNAPLGVVLW